MLNAARSCVAEFWKQTRAPLVSKWITKINESRRMEELVVTDLQFRNYEKFWNCWYYWNDFLASVDFTAAMTNGDGGREDS